MRTGTFGVAAAAVSGSRTRTSSGVQLYADYQTRIGGFGLEASSQVTFGSYEDLASMTAGYLAGGAVFGTAGDRQPPRMINRISISTPLPFGQGSISASYIDYRSAGSTQSQIATVGYSRSLPNNGSLNASAFAELGGHGSYGLLAGLSMPLAGGVRSSSETIYDRGGAHVLGEVSKPLGEQPGSVGWRVRGSQDGSTALSAAVLHRSSHGWAEATIDHANDATVATAQFDGSIATLGSGVFFGDRINDSFAVVETGVAGVPVLAENRPVGVTDRNGRLLVAGLHSYQKNSIAIDPTNLPVNTTADGATKIVTPADRSGALVDLTIRDNRNAAVLVLSKPDGTPVEAGARGRLVDGADFVVGYDGRAYVTGLARRNAIVVETANGQCRASYAFQLKDDQQVVIPVVCG